MQGNFKNSLLPLRKQELEKMCEMSIFGVWGKCPMNLQALSGQEEMFQIAIYTTQAKRANLQY